MGHDIYGYKPSNQSYEIAYLRRGAMDKLKDRIYKALAAMDFYRTASGSGDSRLFTKDELKTALNKLRNSRNEIPTDEIDFIKQCLGNLEDDTIIIKFS